MPSPYEELPQRAFWRTAVADRAPGISGDLYEPRFAIDKSTAIATAGSCFAQHIGRTLRLLGLDLVDAEPVSPPFGEAVALRYGYRSARYGNIYTALQFAQLLEEASGLFEPAEPVWTRGGRFFDAQRPAIEPDGLDSAERVLDHRAAHLPQVIEAFSQADVTIFTFGMTEAWIHKGNGTVYPTAPGTVAGDSTPPAMPSRITVSARSLPHSNGLAKSSRGSIRPCASSSPSRPCRSPRRPRDDTSK